MYLTRHTYANFSGFSSPSLLIKKNAVFKPGIICCQVSGARKSPLARNHPEIHIKTLSPKNFSCFPFGSGKMTFTWKFHLQSPSLAFMREAEGQNDIAAATFPDIFNSQTVYQTGRLVFHSFMPSICKVLLCVSGQL